MSWYQYRGEWIPARLSEPPDVNFPEPTQVPACQCELCGRDVWPGEYTFDGLCRLCFCNTLIKDWTLPEIAEQLGYDPLLQ